MSDLVFSICCFILSYSFCSSSISSKLKQNSFGNALNFSKYLSSYFVSIFFVTTANSSTSTLTTSSTILSLNSKHKGLLSHINMQKSIKKILLLYNTFLYRLGIILSTIKYELYMTKNDDIATTRSDILYII